MNYCDINLVLQEIVIQKQQLKACGPWMKALLLGRLLGTTAAPLLESHLQLVVGDSSTVQEPGPERPSIDCIWRWIWCDSS